MLRKCDDIRNEGIEGVLPTTGSTPSSTARHHAACMRGVGAAERLRQRPGNQDLNHLIHRPRTGGDGLVYESSP
jgi:hypothetical protein